MKSMRLLGIYYEGKGNLDKASDIYMELLEGSMMDSSTMKRMIAIYRDREMFSECIQMINKYLEVNMNDFDLWLELADIYLLK